MGLKNQTQKTEEIKEILKELFCPLRLFAYGSRVTNNAKDNSDYDFVIVVRKSLRSRWENHELAKTEILKRAGVIADVWVYTEKDFDAWKEEFSSIPETALNTGLELTLE